jgi:hypothetical protein
MGRQAKTGFVESFWSKVEIKNKQSCWLWTRSKTPDGYGVSYRGPIKGSTTSAHRVAWEITYGDIEDGLNVLHKCDNRLCCNPYHLYLGTQGQNMCDRQVRYNGNSKFGRPSRLSSDDKESMKNMFFNLGIDQELIASTFGVHQTTVSKIVNNRYNTRR